MPKLDEEHIKAALEWIEKLEVNMEEAVHVITIQEALKAALAEISW